MKITMKKSGIDLHVHSNQSDGTLTPTELAKALNSVGIRKAALTDHDTVTGVEEFLSTAKKFGMDAVSGIEFSVQYDGELHILGYAFDYRDVKIGQYMKRLAAERVERAHAFVKKLRELSIDIRFEELEEFAKGAVIGRPHIACVLVKKGYASSIEEAFKRYLDTGGLAFCPRKRITSKEAIDLIRGTGGVAVLAHPKLIDHANYGELVPRLVAEGLHGIEAYYPEHTNRDVEYFCEIARKYNLIVTSGSDYHGARRTKIKLGQEQRDSEFLKVSVDTIFHNLNNLS